MIKTVADFKKIYYRLESTRTSSRLSVQTRDFQFNLNYRGSPYKSRIELKLIDKGHNQPECVILSNEKYTNIILNDSVYEIEETVKELGFDPLDAEIYGEIPGFVIRRLVYSIEPRELLPDWMFDVNSFKYIFSFNSKENTKERENKE